jgi:hypothetical protein
MAKRMAAGDVTDANHQKWIELLCFQRGVGRGIGSATSGAASREGSIPSPGLIANSVWLIPQWNWLQMSVWILSWRLSPS